MALESLVIIFFAALIIWGIWWLYTRNSDSSSDNTDDNYRFINNVVDKSDTVQQDITEKDPEGESSEDEYIKSHGMRRCPWCDTINPEAAGICAACGKNIKDR